MKAKNKKSKRLAKSTKGKAKKKGISKVSESITLPHTCPFYPKITAKTMQQADDLFGFRVMTDKQGNQVKRIQTYSRKARSAHGVKMRSLKSSKKALRGIDLRTKEGISKLSGKRSKASQPKSKLKSKKSKTRNTKTLSKRTLKRSNKATKKNRGSSHGKNTAKARKLVHALNA